MRSVRETKIPQDGINETGTKLKQYQKHWLLICRISSIVLWGVTSEFISSLLCDATQMVLFSGCFANATELDGIVRLKD